MGAITDGLGWSIEAVLRPLDRLPPAASLAVVAAITAVIMLAVIRRTSPQRAISRARAQMAAALLETRLYLDHPARMLAAQARLVGWTAAYLACLVPSLVLLAIPLGLLYLHLDARHGLAPLAAPGTAVVRIALDRGAAVRDVAIQPDGGVAVTARVRADDEHAVYARLAIRTPGAHALVIRAGGTAARKQVSADPDARVVSPERRRGIARLWTVGVEPALGSGPIRAITIQHPARADHLPVRWWLYWLGLATVIALALRRRFGVVF